MKMEMLLVLLLFTCHESSTTAASTTDRNTNFRIASAGCKEQCGNVRIPFPFGIDIGPNPNCSYDEWFRIDCINDSKPILTKAKLEVLDISTNGTLLVNSPITFFCDEQTDGSSKPVTDLKGSPFVYSRSENVFTALSCDYFASVRSNDTAHPVIAGGCTSACDKDTSELNCDIGVNCCRTSIPPYLTSIVAQANFFNESDILNDCSKFAFLVEKDWFEENSNYASTVSGFKADMKKKRKVPVALDWRINNDTRSFNSFHNFTVNRSLYEQDVRGGFYNNLTTFRYPWNPSCYITTLRNRSEIVCSCILGFEGNPYLFSDIDDPSHICVDIDECKDDRYYPQCYGRNNKCVNDYGGYHCKHDKRKAPNKRKAHDKRKAKLILATGLSSSLGLLMLLIGAWFGYKFLKKRNEIKRKKMFFKRNGGLLLEQELSSGKVDVEQIKLFKSEELEKSTDNFNTDRILGQGGQGTVYKGMLKDGKIVAVKKSKMVDESQLSEFINEVVILSQLNHRNIVKLLGCCLETEVPLLVYEFIPNGTLSQYITKQIEEFPLTWKMRLRIATEIAGALSHLHYTASFPIYHRDIKSTNILLDEKYRAKVADFGTSRSIAIDQTHLTTSLVHGTFGYLDPEYFQSSQFTEKSDVYSFGVVLVELLTGQKPISFLRSEDEGRSLATYFLISMQKDRLFEIVDAQVLKDGPKEDITAVANLARRCLNLNGRERPTMREVTTELEVIQKTRKGVEGEEPHEEVEYLRNDSVEPWDITSSSSATVAGPVSTNADIPLLYFKSL